MMAAGIAAQCGACAALLEKGPIVGRKLRISGKGRGNITNSADMQRFIEAFSPNGRFLYGAFSRFFRDDLLEVLSECGIETKTERGGRIFPVSDKASDVAAALQTWMTAAGVQLRTGVTARSVSVYNGRVNGVVVHGGTMSADAVIIATGGASYPKTGSTGDGYAMARKVGHSIVTPQSALSAMMTEEEWVRNLQGLSLRNVTASLYHTGQSAGKPIASQFGEMLFTHNGVSGPIILTLSRTARTLLRSGKVSISIDLKPALSAEQLHAKLLRDFTQTRHLGNYIKDLLPRTLSETFVYLTGIDPSKPVNSITAEQRTRIVDILKDFRLTATRLAPLEEAIVTAGGVSTQEIDPRTMQSKIVGGLYFAGEVIDIDAETGGFNLQAAFSTGGVAGKAAACSSLL